jgi:hypothetical protein
VRRYVDTHGAVHLAVSGHSSNFCLTVQGPCAGHAKSPTSRGADISTITGRAE